MTTDDLRYRHRRPRLPAESEMTKTQKKIEHTYQRLMDLRDSTPSRRGHITAERDFTKVYMRAYRTSRLTEFYGAAEKYRHFLQDSTDLRRKE